jgi:hypothetical protein
MFKKITYKTFYFWSIFSISGFFTTILAPRSLFPRSLLPAPCSPLPAPSSRASLVHGDLKAMIRQKLVPFEIFKEADWHEKNQATIVIKVSGCKAED